MGTKRKRICRVAVTAIALMICFGIAVEAAGVTTIGENHSVSAYLKERAFKDVYGWTVYFSETIPH